MRALTMQEEGYSLQLKNNWRSLYSAVLSCSLNWSDQANLGDLDEFFLLGYAVDTLWMFEEEGWVDGGLAARLRTLDHIADLISDEGEDGFSDERLRESPLWAWLREVANSCIADMRVEPWVKCGVEIWPEPE